MKGCVEAAIEALQENINPIVSVPSDIRYGKASWKDAQNIAAALRGNNAARRLEMGTNAIGGGISQNGPIPKPEGITSLVSALVQPGSALEYLGLRDNYLAPEHGYALGELLEVNVSLESLDLSNNYLGDGLIQLIAGLKINKTLRHLDISANDLTQDAVRAIASMIKLNNSLETLDMGCAFSHRSGKKDVRGSIQETGAKLLAEGLERNNTLRKLSLAYGKIGLEGATDIIKAINSQQAVRELDLSNSFPLPIPSRTSDFLHALSQNNSLRKIDLSGIDTKGTFASNVAYALRDHEQLMELKIDSTPTENTPIINYLKSCRNLTKISVPDGKCANDTMQLFISDHHKNLVLIQYNDDTLYATPNLQVAEKYIKLLQSAPEEITGEQLADIQERAPGIAETLYIEHRLSKERVDELFAIAKSRAFALNIPFTLPACMDDVPAQTKIPVASAAQPAISAAPPSPPIDVPSLTSIDDLRAPVPTRKLEYPSKLVQLVSEGKWEEVLQLEERSGARLQPDDYQMRETYLHPSVIELLTQQQKLASVFSHERWQGDSHNFQQVASLVAPEEFERQVGISAEVMAQQLSIFENQHHRKKFIRPANLGRSVP